MRLVPGGRFTTHVFEGMKVGDTVLVGRKPTGTLLLDNLLVGRGALDLPGDAVVQRNHRLDWSAFAQAAREDYRLVPAARAALGALPVAEIDQDLLPRHEYRHPTSLQPVDGPTRYPGAMQSPAP